MINNKRVLGMMGLAARARKITFGADSTIQELDRKKVKLVIVATDASERTKRKFTEKCNMEDIPIMIYGNIEEISKAIGKNNKAIIGITDNNLAKEIEKIIRGDINGENQNT